jgi:hypothetical protein
MADDGSKQRKPDFRTAVEDVEALAMVLVMKLESVLGRRLKLRSPAVLAAIGVITTLVLALGVVMALLRTGDANAVSDNAALIGALVALGGVFTAQIVSIALDDRRTHEARALEAQRADEAALQNYFEAVGELLIEKPLRRASPGDNLSTVVRAQTLSVLEGLDPDHKRILLQFLYESRLIQKDRPVVSLVLADLSNANLYNTILTMVNLRGANLSRAVLDLAGLNRAVLSDAYLGNASLRGTHLMGADLSRAVLLGADLSAAKMQGATGVTSQELEQQAYSLEGAIMPDGSKHP